MNKIKLDDVQKLKMAIIVDKAKDKLNNYIIAISKYNKVKEMEKTVESYVFNQKDWYCKADDCKYLHARFEKVEPTRENCKILTIDLLDMVEDFSKVNELMTVGYKELYNIDKPYNLSFSSDFSRAEHKAESELLSISSELMLLIGQADAAKIFQSHIDTYVKAEFKTKMLDVIFNLIGISFDEFELMIELESVNTKNIIKKDIENTIEKIKK